MAKLKPDYIEWGLTLNSSQAQDEYHKLEKANKEQQKQTLRPPLRNIARNPNDPSDKTQRPLPKFASHKKRAKYLKKFHPKLPKNVHANVQALLCKHVHNRAFFY